MKSYIAVALLFNILWQAIAAGTCSVSISAVARGASWMDDGVNFQIFDLTITNTGSCSFSQASVTFSIPAGSINEAWNYDANTHALSSFGNLAPGASASAVAGLVVTGGVTPTVSTASATCSASCAAAPTTPPTNSPTSAPTSAPTRAPTSAPTRAPTSAPTSAPTRAPTSAPTSAPTRVPTSAPTAAPTRAPTSAPTNPPTSAPTRAPTSAPTRAPTSAPTNPPTTPIDTNCQLSVTQTRRTGSGASWVAGANTFQLYDIDFTNTGTETVTFAQFDQDLALPPSGSVATPTSPWHLVQTCCSPTDSAVSFNLSFTDTLGAPGSLPVGSTLHAGYILEYPTSATLTDPTFTTPILQTQYFNFVECTA